MQLYVEHFNKDIKGLQEKIPYFKKLGINFLHLMPITTRPKDESDGGYAVNNYLEVDKKYGSKEDLLELTKAFRKNGIYLMLDFVVNHTSDEFSGPKKRRKVIKNTKATITPMRILPSQQNLKKPCRRYFPKPRQAILPISPKWKNG